MRSNWWNAGLPLRVKCRAYVDDLADACDYLMDAYSGDEPVNIGTGEDISDGTPRKLLDVNRLNNLGWRPKIPLRKGIQQTYRWFLNTVPAEIRA